MQRLIRFDRNDPEDLQYFLQYLFALALAGFWLAATIIMLCENFKNGVPPEPAWWLALEAAIGVTW